MNITRRKFLRGAGRGCPAMAFRRAPAQRRLHSGGSVAGASRRLCRRSERADSRTRPARGPERQLRNAVSGLPVCSPYRGSLMTGQYPSDQRRFHQRRGFRAQDTDARRQAFRPRRATRPATSASGTSTAARAAAANGGPTTFRRTSASASTTGKSASAPITITARRITSGDDRTQRVWPGYDAIAQTEDACAFIGAPGQSGRSVFPRGSRSVRPHSPYGTAPEPLPRAIRKTCAPIAPATFRPADARRRTADLRGYYAHIAALDDCVANLARRAREKSSRPTTPSSVFTSDHGDMLHSQALLAKHYPWERIDRRPLPAPLSRKTRQRRPHDSASRSMRRTSCRRCSAWRACPMPGAVQGSDLSSVILAPAAHPTPTPARC